MKKTLEKLISIMLAVAVVFSCVSAGFFSIEASAVSLNRVSGCKTGDIIEFGSYPQSKVTDEALIAELNLQTLNWVSYSYYSGKGKYGSMEQGDWMKYADVTYDGNRYRAVEFSQYRPSSTCGTLLSGTHQDDNGYYTNTIYWFKYEPLKWRVLDPDFGLVLCESIIDSQAFCNTVYRDDDYYDWKLIFSNSALTNKANVYRTSSIRKWLNDDFYSTAFTGSEKAEIREAYSDKVFIPSVYDVTDTDYGFSENYYESGKVSGTDYAKCQGLGVDNYGYSDWWLESLFDEGLSVYIVASSDAHRGYIASVDDTGVGVCPALKFAYKPPLRLANSESVFENSGIKITANEGADKISVYPTTTEGKKVTIKTEGTPIKVSSSGTYYLKLDDWHKAGCDVETTMTIGGEDYSVKFDFPSVVHTEVVSGAVAPTCTETGLTGNTKCSVCGKIVKDSEVVPALGHSYCEWSVVTQATCTETGVKSKTCALCPDTVTEKIPALGHSYGEWSVVTEATCTEMGVKSKTCTLCSDTVTEDISALGHKEGQWTVVKEATKTERGKEELRCTVCQGLLDEKEIPSIEETLVNSDDLMPIRGTAETKTYKDEDYIALVKRSGATSVGLYKETADGGSVEIELENGVLTETSGYYVAYESQNKTNPAGKIKVTYSDGTVKQSRVIFELYDIDMKVDINPTETIKPIRGSASVKEDVAGEYIEILVSKGQYSTGIYKDSLDGTPLILLEMGGLVQEKSNLFIAYGSQNDKNPDGRLHVVLPDGTEATYRIVFKLYETDVDAFPLECLKPLRGTVTVENDGAEDYVRVKRTEGQSSVGVYKLTTNGLECEITDVSGTLQDKSNLYIAYKTQNKEDITGKITFTKPDGTTQTYKIIFEF